MDIQRINKYRKELMGLASLWIFYYHVGPVLFSESKLTFLRNCEWYINSLGYCGVEMFLFISGMGLVYAIHKQDLVRFYIRRFLRVYPSFWIWFTLSTLIRNDSMSLMDYLGRITFYSNWMQDMLAYKWYIAAIMMFYLWFPFYYIVLKKIKYPIIFTILIIVVEVCFGSIFYSNIRSDLFLFLNRIPVFLAGVLAGHLCVEKKKSRLMQSSLSLNAWGILILILACIIGCSFYLHRKTEVYAWCYNFRNILDMMIATGFCVIWPEIFELLEKNKAIQVLKKGLKCQGEISLEFYLVHELIALKIKSYDLHFMPFYEGNQVIVVFICYVVSFIAAWMLWKSVAKLLGVVDLKYMNSSNL